MPSRRRRWRSVGAALACCLLLAGCRIGELSDPDSSPAPSSTSTEVVEELATPAGREGAQVLAVLRYGVARPPAEVVRVDEYTAEDDRSLTLVYLDAAGQTLAIQRNDLSAYDCVVHEATFTGSICTADGSRNGTAWTLYRVEDPSSWTDLEMVRVAEAPWASSTDVEDGQS